MRTNWAHLFGGLCYLSLLAGCFGKAVSLNADDGSLAGRVADGSAMVEDAAFQEAKADVSRQSDASGTTLDGVLDGIRSDQAEGALDTSLDLASASDAQLDMPLSQAPDAPYIPEAAPNETETMPGSGGIASTGGVTGTGGVLGTGGISSTDKTTDAGGVMSTGGVTGTGGVTSTGGVTTSPGPCSVDPDCTTAGYYCAAGVCVPKRGDGATCTGVNQCTSGNCVSSVCCNTVCGLCNSCATGTCTPVADLTACQSGSVCIGGACISCAQGSSCQPSSSPCRTGTISCSSGTAQCVATGNQSDGTLCPPGPSCTNGRFTDQSKCSSGSCTTPPTMYCPTTGCNTSAQTPVCNAPCTGRTTPCASGCCSIPSGCSDIYIGPDSSHAPPTPYWTNSAIVPPSDVLTRDTAVIISVTVQNSGNVSPASTLELYWGDPTTGCLAVASHLIGRVGDVSTWTVPTYTVIPPADGTITTNFAWTPDAAAFSTNGGHVCLLARTEFNSSPGGGCPNISWDGTAPQADPHSGIRNIQVVAP
jgi:hypothetical protein